MNKKLIFFFLDGVGIGGRSAVNPFFLAKADCLPIYQNGPGLPDGEPVKSIDACLGVPGMPMSATGQTALWTGVNMPRLLGRHKDSYPDSDMRRVIKKKNLFTRLKKHRITVRFLNAYPGHSHFFTADYIRIRENGDLYFSPAFPPGARSTLSVSSCMMLSSFMRPFGSKEIINEIALFHDYTNDELIRQGINLPRFSPERAAEIIYKTSRHYDLLLYEFFLTDLYGHGFETDQCVKLIRDLDRLLKHLTALMDIQKDTLLITSDHGNLEDRGTEYHTTNPVPLITWGRESESLRKGIKNLTDVTPAIESFFIDH